MAVIKYYFISELAIKLKSQLSEEEFRQLIEELINNNIAEFQEYRKDSLATGNYARITTICRVCGRPI